MKRIIKWGAIAFGVLIVLGAVSAALRSLSSRMRRSPSTISVQPPLAC